ncbi:MAG: Lcl C-terminal domain-containing protein [Desulfuromonadales bacterium]
MQKLFIIPFVLVLLAVFTAPVCAEQALVPQSGMEQVPCYDAAGVEIPCAGTGQDGEQQMGIPWPAPRFTDNGNGTITDNLTGLIWLKNANCFGGKIWTGALSSANTLASGTCGLTDGSVAGDWRLPNKKELESLINRRQANPAVWLNLSGFTGVATGSNIYSDSYWSSTTYHNDINYKWYVLMGSGLSDAHHYTSYLHLVWPVRGGQ